MLTQQQIINRLAYSIDILFMLFAASHWALFVLALMQYAVRRSPLFANSFLDLFGVETINTLVLILLPGAEKLMSSEGTGEGEDQAVVTPVVQEATIAGQPIATIDNTINSQLSDNAVAPEAARDIIRFQAQVEALASLIRSGQVSNIAKGIEETFGCSRSSKPDSVYQRARLALDPLITPGPQYRELDENKQPKVA